MISYLQHTFSILVLFYWTIKSGGADHVITIWVVFEIVQQSVALLTDQNPPIQYAILLCSRSQSSNINSEAVFQNPCLLNSLQFQAARVPCNKSISNIQTGSEATCILPRHSVNHHWASTSTPHNCLQATCWHHRHYSQRPWYCLVFSHVGGLY